MAEVQPQVKSEKTVAKLADPVATTSFVNFNLED